MLIEPRARSALRFLATIGIVWASVVIGKLRNNCCVLTGIRPKMRWDWVQPKSGSKVSKKNCLNLFVIFCS